MTLVVLFVAQWAMLVGIGWLATGNAADSPLVRLARAHLAGAALLALSLHGLLAVGVEAPPIWLPGGLAAVVAAGLCLLRRARPIDGDPSLFEETAAVAWASWLLWLLRAMLLLGVATLLSRLTLLPLDWDGWAIWAMKAKALSQGNLQTLLSDPAYYYSHQDYPLLVPTHAWWLSGGGFSEKVAQASGMLFAFDLLVLLYDQLRRRGEGPALAACVLMLSLAPFAKHAASGFADVPMAAYALATCLALREGRLLGLALFLLGALLTKNEGLFALAAVAAAWAISPARMGSTATRRVPGAGAAIAAALAVLPWMVVKRRWGAGADLLDPSQWVLGEMVARLGVIGQGFVRQALAIGPQYPGWGLLWPSLGFSAALSIRKRLTGTGVYWLFLSTFMSGAAAAYLVTPLNPALHLDRSIDRLWLHVAPIAVIAVVEALVPRSADSDAN